MKDARFKVFKAMTIQVVFWILRQCSDVPGYPTTSLHSITTQKDVL
jgi:hypothetical protein